jgi:hypothetical protein
MCILVTKCINTNVCITRPRTAYFQTRTYSVAKKVGESNKLITLFTKTVFENFDPLFEKFSLIIFVSEKDLLVIKNC